MASGFLFSAALSTREEFLKVLNLAGIDVLTVKLRLDRKVHARIIFLISWFALMLNLLARN